MARNAPLTKPLSRMLGDAPGHKDRDLLITINPDGTIRLEAKPRHRLQRGEVMPTVTLNLLDVFKEGGKITVKAPAAIGKSTDTPKLKVVESDIQEKVRDVFHKMHIAPVDYSSKVAMLKAMRDVFPDLEYGDLSGAKEDKVYLLVTDECEYRPMTREPTDREMDLCDQGALDILDITYPEATLKYVEGEWQELEDGF